MSKRIPVITRKQVAKLLPKRAPDSHKGMYGAVAVVGGAAGMLGAPLLAARAALKMGAGSVHVGLLAENAPTVDMIQPELMLHGAQDAFHQINPDVIAIGPGLGASKEAQLLLYAVLKRNVPLVMDADALNLLASHADLQDDLHNRQADTVLTPHPGEAARLLGCSTGEIQADRTGTIQMLARKFQCSIVLKGANSLCITSDGELFINKTGNPGMSSAGTGDVLTGMLSAFIAQGLSVDESMLLAVYLHGAAGDKLAEQGIAVGMTASDVTEWARWLLNQLGPSTQ
jgi:hydroxyethylthiazole kinase-like uncharacterized protein yjeF